MKRKIAGKKAETLLLILAFTLPISLRALDSFFTFDDLMNLDYYTARPAEALISNLVVFTSFHRPAGALLYLPIYYSLGMEPQFFYLAGALLYSLNIVLLFLWVMRLTKCRLTTLITVTLAALHPTVHNVLYNFGAVFELLTLTFVLCALLCYKAYLDNRIRRLWYWLAWVCYLAALNAKETAVMLPLIFFSYEWVYLMLWRRDRQTFARSLKRTAPFFGIAALYTLVKFFGSEAYWRNNPLYIYQSDWTWLHNLTSYFRYLINQELHLTEFSVLTVLFSSLSLAMLLRNRHMLFGLVFGLLTLVPVLPLPRVWDLFLYVPIAGFSLYVAGLIAELLTRLRRRFLDSRLIGYRPARITTVLLTTLFLGWIFNAMIPDIERARLVHYHYRTAPWRSFLFQFRSFYPTMPEDASLAFEAPPFDPGTHDRWCLHFLVRLSYGYRNIGIYRLPEEMDRFSESLTEASEAHQFVWRNGVLLEQDISYSP